MSISIDIFMEKIGKIQCSTFIILYMGSIGMDHVISELWFTGTILQRNYRKMTIKLSFSYNSFEKFQVKIFGIHIMTMLYPNLCYNEVCNKGTTL